MNTMLPTRKTEAPPEPGIGEICELWGLAIPVALLGSWTCFAAVPGVNWTLWTIAAAAGFLFAGRRARPRHESLHSRLALSLACLLGGAAAITANPHSDALIFLFTAALCTYAVLSISVPAWDIGPATVLRAPLTVWRLLPAEAASRLDQTLAVARMRDAVPLLRGGTMAAALSGVLFLLLSAADPTLAEWRDAAWTAVLSWTFVARDVFFFVLATLLLGTYGLASRASSPASRAPSSVQRPSPQQSATHGSTAPPVSSAHHGSIAVHSPGMGEMPVPELPSMLRISDIERMMVLGAAMALFMLFFGVELASRLGARGLHLASGETLAAATHRGFGEMIFAAALSAIVLVTLERRALRGRRERAVRLIGWGVIAASLLLVVSAYERVRFYEAAYGYTEQRLYVQVCCGAVFAGLLLLAWELRSSIDLPRLTRNVALVAVLCVGGLSYWNGAAWIVEANVARYEATGQLDARYLTRLARYSPDAIPALVASLPAMAPADAHRVRDALRHALLRRSILVPRGPIRELSWYEWSLRRASARSALRAAGLLDGA